MRGSPVTWRVVVRFLQVSLLAAAVHGAVGGRHDLVLNAGVGLGFTVAPGLVARRYGTRVPAWLVAWLGAAAALHVAGMVLGLYWPPRGFDDLTHAVSGSALAAVGYQVVGVWERRSPGVALGTAFRVALVLVVVSAGGVCWEVVEFAVSRGVQLGLFDTLTDLLYNLLGGAIAVAVARRPLATAAEVVASGMNRPTPGQAGETPPEPSR